MVSLFAKIDSIDFWLKTMDYSKAFCFFERCYGSAPLELKYITLSAFAVYPQD